MAAEGSVRGVRVNKPVLILLTVIATVIGLAPVVFLRGRPQWLLYIAAGSAVMAVLYSFRLSSSATNSPSLSEFLLGGVGAVFPPALLGTLGLIVYAVIYGATKLVESVAVRLGSQMHVNVDLIAFYPAVLLASLLGITFVRLSEDNMAAQLYPREGGIKTAFHDLFRQERRRLIGCTAVALLVLGGILVLFLALGSVGTTFYVLVQFYLMAVSASLWMLSTDTRPREAVEVIESVGQLFVIAGYQVERFPRTGKADVDPLLADVDLFAQRGAHKVVVDVKTASESPESIDSTAAAGLTMATWVLSEQRGLSPDEVNPLMVLVDVKADKSLGRFSKREGMKVVRVQSEEVQQILAEGSVEERQEAVRRLLGVPIGVGDVITSSASQGGGA